MKNFERIPSGIEFMQGYTKYVVSQRTGASSNLGGFTAVEKHVIFSTYKIKGLPPVSNFVETLQTETSNQVYFRFH